MQFISISIIFFIASKNFLTTEERRGIVYYDRYTTTDVVQMHWKEE